MPTIEETSSHQSKNTDDELGFDPFHETQKALAEMLEKESISNLTNGSAFSNGCSNLGYSGPVQSLYSNPPVPPSMARHSPSFSSLGLGLGLGVGVGVAPQPQPSRTRIPPPGFNPSQVFKNNLIIFFQFRNSSKSKIITIYFFVFVWSIPSFSILLVPLIKVESVTLVWASLISVQVVRWIA